MAIKKKSILTDNQPQSLNTPAFGQSVAVPFAINFPANRNIIPGNVPNPTAYVRPTQIKGFDISITDLTKPNPVYLNDLNGIFYLYSNVISDLCGGTPIQFDPNYITAQINAGNSPGYQLDAILFSYPNNAWYRSLAANNQTSPATPAITPTWQQITIPNLPVLGYTTLNAPIKVPATSVQFANAFVETIVATPNLATVTPFVNISGFTTTDDTDPDVDTPDVFITVKATSINFAGATVAGNGNIATVTVTAPVQILRFTNKGQSSNQNLVKPDGATSVIFTATAFGGNSGANNNNYAGGGGGCGGGFNRLSYELPLLSYQVSYVATPGNNPSGQISIPGNTVYIILDNGQNGFDATSSAGGNGGSAGNTNFPNYSISPPQYGNGQTGGSGIIAYGGSSVLSNEQQVRAFADARFGGGAGSGGSGGNIGGDAIVIAEWVFPSV